MSLETACVLRVTFQKSVGNWLSEGFLAINLLTAAIFPQISQVILRKPGSFSTSDSNNWFQRGCWNWSSGVICGWLSLSEFQKFAQYAEQNYLQAKPSEDMSSCGEMAHAIEQYVYKVIFLQRDFCYLSPGKKIFSLKGQAVAIDHHFPTGHGLAGLRICLSFS